MLDPNVLVAALLSRRGAPAKLLRLWLDGVFEVVVSPSLLAELQRVLAYPKIRASVSEVEAAAFLALLEGGATTVNDPTQSSSLRTADPNDDYLVALAEAARAIIVSGDRHLLDMAGRLPVYSPADSLRLVSAPERE